MKPIAGWVLVSKEDGEWFICWHEIFEDRSRALEFATENKWVKPWKTIRARLAAVK